MTAGAGSLRALLLVVATWSTGAGCSGAARQERDGADSTTAVAASSGPGGVGSDSALVRRDGSWTEGDAVVTWSAWYRGGTLVRIEERVAQGEYGTSRVRFEAPSGALADYREEGRRLATGPGSTQGQALDSVVVVARFDATGGLVRGGRTINGVASALDSTTVRQIAARFSRIAGAAEDSAAAQTRASGGGGSAPDSAAEVSVEQRNR